MKIYTTVHEHYETAKSDGVKMLNIVHVHLNDSSEDVTIDVAYMDKGTKVDDFKVFGKDATGRVLRYKILVKDMKIFHVLYNTGDSFEDVPFHEISVSRKQKVVVTSPQLGTCMGMIT
jgi:hypothetical protein